jgi:polar amino acid transport system substrate-binding protein
MLPTRLALIIILITLAIRPVSGESTALCVYTEYAPANFFDKKDGHTGFFIDIARELFERRLGIRLEFSVYPWARCQAMLERGEADFIMTIPTEERKRYAQEVPTPIWTKQYKIVTTRDNPKRDQVNDIRTKESLIASKFSVVSYLGNNWAKEQLEAFGVPLITAPTVEGMYSMIVAKRGDLIVEDSLLAQTYITAHGLDDQLIITSGVIDESPFHILLGRKSPLMNSFPEISKALREMKRDGTIEGIMAYYERR